jgi:hypothetical protein
MCVILYTSRITYNIDHTHSLSRSSISIFRVQQYTQHAPDYDSNATTPAPAHATPYAYALYTAAYAQARTAERHPSRGENEAS